MIKKLAEFYKALSDETRLKILQMLSQREMCVCEIIDKLDMTQPAVSHHLKILKQAGLVNDSKEGKWIYYSINSDVFNQVLAGEDREVIRTLAAPVKTILNNLPPSPIRTDPSLCETLASKSSALKAKK